MKKILAVILCLTFVLAAFGSIAVLAEEATETTVEGFEQDDENKVFKASTADALMQVAATINAGGYSDYDIVIEADIDMDGKVWRPIASEQGNIYCGTVYGNGHTITGLSVQNYAKSLGFIGFARPGTVIENLHLRGINFSSTSPYNGALVGRIEGSLALGAEVQIIGCTVQGTLRTTSNYAGGLVGAFFDKVGSNDIDSETGKTIYYAPRLRVENCAVNMTLSSDVNYAAGIIAGDSFRESGDTSVEKNGGIWIEDDLPTVTCKKVFVTGTYKAPEGCQASGFIGYMNRVEVTLEDCFSAAKIAGGEKVSGSFFSRTKSCVLTVRNCYSMSDMPFSGEIQNLAYLKDSAENVIESMTIVNSYAMQLNGKDAPFCTTLTTLTKPTEPIEGATAEEIAAYEEALALYNSLVIVNLNNKNYGIEGVAGVDAEGNQVINLTVPSKHQQTLLSEAQTIVPRLFAANSKQLELFNAYIKATKCDHTNIVNVASSQYIALNATCTSKAQYFKSCEDCGIAMEDMETFESGAMAKHTYAERWGYDETTHYHACTSCREATTDVAFHTMGAWEVAKAASTTKEGKEERECPTCGYVEERSIPKLAPVTDTPAEEEEKGGCGSVIGGATIIVMLAAAGAVVLRKKED